MNTKYFTFGQSHRYEFDNIILDKDIVLKITDKNPRQVMFDIFGPKWSLEKDEKPDMKYFSRGIYELTKENKKKWIEEKRFSKEV